MIIDESYKSRPEGFCRSNNSDLYIGVRVILNCHEKRVRWIKFQKILGD